MTTSLDATLAPSIAAPAALLEGSRNWTRFAGPAVSLLILAGVAYQLHGIDHRRLLALLPASALFWAAFALYYFATPLSEWVIFRRLWNLPARGLPALLRKLVSNEILLGYLGEVYFYAWARQNARIAAAPFGAIKDVAILSAITGNVFTLVLVAAIAPSLGALPTGVSSSTFLASSLVVLVSSMAVLLLRRRLFTLPRNELWFVTALHSARIVLTLLLAALLWHLLLPAVALGWWLLLATVRQLISRLPLVPNKDVVFVGVAAFFVGAQSEIAAAVALLAALTLAAHLLVGMLLVGAELTGDSAR